MDAKKILVQVESDGTARGIKVTDGDGNNIPCCGIEFSQALDSWPVLKVYIARNFLLKFRGEAILGYEGIHPGIDREYELYTKSGLVQEGILTPEQLHKLMDCWLGCKPWSPGGGIRPGMLLRVGTRVSRHAAPALEIEIEE